MSTLLIESSDQTPAEIASGRFNESGTDQDHDTPVTSLPNILVRTSREITSVLNTLYRSRGFLEQAAEPRLQRTHQNLRQASEASETATHTLLDGLGHALVLIDQLDHSARPQDATPLRPDHAIRFDLREEVYRLICSLQFQDIVAQQIGYATRVLEDTERRLARLTEQFDVAVFGGRSVSAEDEPAAEDHDATIITNAAIERQAIADSVFGSVHTNQDVRA
jgi:hypothetical protein